ncbi:tRNA(Met)-cytidine N(4)-acetyltransferase [Mangrovibacter plantisponsor]|uniref:tRNA(Met) cytidine acetyltransferase TmcA n=2 Tax=Mangrovibacter plantisponsor TaxID=451513 RepID=A0A317Q1U7_9ENTR|nr:tRNA(Met)-cytidine N(4)-acetyltransferase [Mangrovibacter plantisponsor]
MAHLFPTDNWLALTQHMARAGQRRLLLLAGDNSWSESQAAHLQHCLPGDWLWVSDKANQAQACPPRNARALLGREFHHAVFDARLGFDAEAFAILAGTLRAGSWLVMLTPPFADWPNRPDCDSQRWNDQQQPTASPQFVARFLAVLQSQSAEMLVWHQGQAPVFPAQYPLACWHPVQGEPLQTQAAIRDELLAMASGIAVVTAGRGRGKSALAGMLIRAWQGTVLVTAPARVATDVMAEHAHKPLAFIAPDGLLEQMHSGKTPHADWLVVDEAAAIPLPQLAAMIEGFSRVLLISTVQGYEGTGQGFILKLCSQLPASRRYVLNTPVRWAPDCPLELFVSSLLLFDESGTGTTPVSGEMLPAPVFGTVLPSELTDVYRLLSSAHYRTSPLDLRRLLDAPGQHVVAAKIGGKPIAAAWLVTEGGLTQKLSEAVWAGFRRPRGNLVAQSLAAHGGSPRAAMLTGWRVSRIAVYPGAQRKGVGQALIAEVKRQAPAGCDYLSVSFGYTQALWRFWERCGFRLVRMGTSLEASSGCYTAMALLPLTQEGEALAANEARHLSRNLSCLQPWLPFPLPGEPDTGRNLLPGDWRELAGFAWGYRPLMSCLVSLVRVLAICPLELPALRGELQSRQPAAVLCGNLGLAGRKALLSRQRLEAGQILVWHDENQAHTLKAWLAQLQFFD